MYKCCVLKPRFKYDEIQKSCSVNTAVSDFIYNYDVIYLVFIIIDIIICIK